ncbi:MAG: biopolymer transporter ExbD [Vicinamibacterales bacterium]
MPKLEPMQNGSGRAGGRRGRASRVSSSLAEINVVPLVDVMLVLLVIFMVAAPMMTQGFKVDLPQSRRAPAVDREPVTVSIPRSFAKDHRVLLGTESVPLDVLGERVNQALEGQARRSVILASDGQVIVQDMLTVMDELKAAGIDGVAIPTQPPTRRRVP